MKHATVVPDMFGGSELDRIQPSPEIIGGSEDFVHPKEIDGVGTLTQKALERELTCVEPTPRDQISWS